MSDFEKSFKDTAMGSAECNGSEILKDCEKDSIITQIIDDLATDTDYSSDTRFIFHIEALESVYKCGTYKEKYAEIFATLSKYLGDKEVSLEVLQINLETLSNKIKPDLVSINTYRSFLKLEDIINLEISRYGFYNSLKGDFTPNDENLCSGEVKDKLKKLENDIEISNSVTSEAKKAIIHVDDKIEKNSLSSITALSVFSAVVLTFSGGMTVVSGVLGEMSAVSSLRVAFVGSLLGFILFNTIFMLLYIIGNITGKRITKNLSGSFCDSPNGHQNAFCRMIHRYLYVFAVNAIFITLMYYTAVIYLFETFGIYPLYLKIAAGILPIVVLAAATFLSYQPFADKIQQKRLYNLYKEKVLSFLATNSRITGKAREYRRNFLKWNDFDRNTENDLAESIAVGLSSIKKKSDKLKFIERKIHQGFVQHYLFYEETPFISFGENRATLRKTKTVLNFLVSKL